MSRITRSLVFILEKFSISIEISVMEAFNVHNLIVINFVNRHSDMKMGHILAFLRIDFIVLTTVSASPG